MFQSRKTAIRLNDYRPLVRSYARYAPKYDRRWWSYNEATLTATVEAIPRERILRMLNVGCGTGLLEQAVKDLLPGTHVIGMRLPDC